MTTQLVEESTVPVSETIPFRKDFYRETIEEPPRKRIERTRPNPFRETEGMFLEMRGMWSQAYSELMKGKFALENSSKNNY